MNVLLVVPVDEELTASGVPFLSVIIACSAAALVVTVISFGVPNGAELAVSFLTDGTVLVPVSLLMGGLVT